VNVSILPLTANVALGATQQFTATVTGTANIAVSFSVNGIQNGNAAVGTISSTGLYSAPAALPNPTTVTITAKSQADPTKSASATVALVSRTAPTGTWKISGPAGGNITAFAADQSHPGMVYAGMDLGGLGALFKSADSGATWTPLVTNSFVDFALVFDISVPVSGAGNIIYTCGGSLFSFSTDAGATWTSITLASSAHGMAVSPFNRAVIYLSAPGAGVLKSQDAGKTWVLLAGSPVTSATSVNGILHNPIVADPGTDGTLYYGTDHGLFVTTDGGVTWILSGSGIAATDTSIRDIAASFASAGTVFALAGIDTSTVADLYKSTDRGKTWVSLAVGLDAERVIPDAANTSLIYLSGLQVHAAYKSINGGANFTPSDSGMPTGTPTGALAVSGPTGTLMANVGPGNAALAVVGGFGVFRSQDGAATWNLSSAGISSWQGFSIAVDSLHPTTLYLGTSQALFKSIDGGAVWTRLITGFAASIAVDPFDSTHLFVELIGSGLQESHNGGTTWVAVTNLPAVPNGGNVTIVGISFNPKTKGTIFVTTRGAGNVGAVRSIDGGLTYSIVNAGLTSQQATSAVAVNPQTPTMLFVGTAAGIFKSTNNGDSWILSNSTTASVFSFDAKTTPPIIYADRSRSNDLGGTWTVLPGQGFFIADPSTASSVFRVTANIGAPQSAGWSSNQGVTEIPFSNGLGDIVLNVGFGGQGIAIVQTSPQALYVVSTSHGLMKFVVGP
jgi:hypothetical protein